jgi:hypothetical protein
VKDIELELEQSAKTLLSKQSMSLEIPPEAFEVTLRQDGVLSNLVQNKSDDLQICSVKVMLPKLTSQSQLTTETFKRLKRMRLLVAVLGSGNGYFSVSLLYYLNQGQSSLG